MIAPALHNAVMTVKIEPRLLVTKLGFTRVAPGETGRTGWTRLKEDISHRAWLQTILVLEMQCPVLVLNLWTITKKPGIK